MNRHVTALMGSAVLSLVASLSLPTSMRAQDANEGQKAYRQLCMSCHGKDGKAQTPMGRKLGVKDLSQSKLEADAIKKQVFEGVKDESGKQRMPSFKDRLTPEQTAALLEVVKAFRK